MGGYALLLTLALGARPAVAQNDLLKDLERQTTPTEPVGQRTQATFKSIRIINGHSVETASKNTMHFLISHRFGTLNSGAYNFFGLDQGTIRLGLEYGITPDLTVGVGRSSNEKTFDGLIKYRVLHQGTGPGTMPFTATLLGTSAVSTLKYAGSLMDNRPLRARVTYTYQVLLARKFSDGFSAQLMPTWVHRNLVNTRTEQNDVLAVGAALRQKITKRLALTGEYYYVLPGATADDARYHNSIGVGFDIETGGHVFQLHFTNSNGMIEKFFIPQTTGNFFKGDIYFGFNISRAFTIGNRKLKGAAGFSPRT
ncbi:MAG: hypothetical protein H7330_09310 [Hymenobacteraceae bacterium]|nr:hypothetical protein [Hymenobacteraceae bacterium]